MEPGPTNEWRRGSWDQALEEVHLQREASMELQAIFPGAMRSDVQRRAVVPQGRLERGVPDEIRVDQYGLPQARSAANNKIG